jgi:glycosyltransferase involved in cell wall biosynthesis
MGAPAARAYEFSRRWVEAGHKVSVVCGIPNHPHGRVYPGYSKSLLHKEQIDGIDVYRSWVFVTANARILRRTLNYVSFGISAVLASEAVPSPDVCIATSPQFFSGLSGTVVRKLKQVPFVLEIRDLWPDSIEAVNIDMGQATMKLLRSIEKYMYRSADEIVIVSEAFRNHIVEKGLLSEKLHYVPNGVNSALFKESTSDRMHFVAELKEKFLVGYIGTHGMAQGLASLVDAARNLQDQKDLHFLLVGEGAEKTQLKQQASGLQNITFIDRQDRKTIAEMLPELDIALVLLKKAELLKTVIPSKMFEIMGCGLPMILGVEGEAKRILDEAQAGIAIEPGDATALSGAILRLKNDPEGCKRYGKNASDYVRKYFNLDMLANKYLELLESVCS